MKQKINKLGTFLVVALWFVLITILGVFLTSCGKPKNKIEKGDIVQKCQIDSVNVLPQHSTIEPDRKCEYFTSCGSRIVSHEGAFRVGDTVTYVYKKSNSQKN